MKRLLLLLGLFPALASAGTVYRCVGPAGQVSYLAMPCAAGQRMDRSIEFAAVPDSPMMATSRHQRSGSASGRPLPRLRRGGEAPGSRPDPCLQARTKREQQLEQLGLRRTFDELSKLDEPVRKACRGF